MSEMDNVWNKDNSKTSIAGAKKPIWLGEFWLRIQIPLSNFY